jgi:hypothetical protein
MLTIFISAYDLSRHTARMEGCHFLPKPVTGEALDDAVARSLASGETGANLISFLLHLVAASLPLPLMVILVTRLASCQSLTCQTFEDP